MEADQERHIRLTNERLVCLAELMQSPQTYASAARELLEWSTDNRAYEPYFEDNILGCLKVVVQVANLDGFDLELSYRLMAVILNHKHQFTNSAHADLLSGWCEDLGRLLLQRHDPLDRSIAATPTDIQQPSSSSCSSSSSSSSTSTASSSSSSSTSTSTSTSASGGSTLNEVFVARAPPPPYPDSRTKSAVCSILGGPVDANPSEVRLDASTASPVTMQHQMQPMNKMGPQGNMGCFNNGGDWVSSGVPGNGNGGQGNQTSLSVLTTVWGVTSTTQSTTASYNTGTPNNFGGNQQPGPMGQCPPYVPNPGNKGYGPFPGPNNGPNHNGGHMTPYRHGGPPG